MKNQDIRALALMAMTLGSTTLVDEMIDSLPPEKAQTDCPCGRPHYAFKGGKRRRVACPLQKGEPQ